MTEQEEGQIERINQVSAMARTSWIVLLGYLAFVGVTLLAVEDADFFVPTRQTQLPLVDVAIPTASFFIFAPILAAALYIYLHIILLKLWDAIADIESPELGGHPVGDVLNPWLVNDWALSVRGGRFVPARPLRTLGNAASFLLVWAAAPLVLFFFWLWSMPAHDPLLTLMLAACFLIALSAGATSWRTAHDWLSGTRAEPRQRPYLWSVGTFLSGFRTSRTARDSLADLAQATRVRAWGPRDVWYLGVFLVSVTLLATTWPLQVGLFSTLARADLIDVEMVDLPEGWRAWETAREGFRETWCRRQGIDMSDCGPPPDRDAPPSVQIVHDRGRWCTDHGIGEGQPCHDAFGALDTRFTTDWRTERESAIADLPRLDLVNGDLRRAIAPNVTLVGADLFLARLEGANLGQARLEGANLGRARLEGADLFLARLEGADLFLARLEGANLGRARLEGANLGQARLEGANLVRARLEGANLFQARLEGANLFRARLEGAYLSRARLEGASLVEARLEGAYLGQARLEGANLVEARLEGANLGEARLEGANLVRARLEGADLFLARLEGANLGEARLEGANLGQARLEGANLGEARLEGANLVRARLEGADLFLARLEGANLHSADFRKSNWASASTTASPAQFADFRGSQDLTQAQLGHFIGNAGTLLPDGPSDTGEPFYVWSCWETPPPGFDAIVATVAGPFADRAALRAEFLCSPDNPRRKTGTPLALDAPYPDGHPLEPD